MLKKDLTLQIVSWSLRKVKNKKKVIGLLKDELGGEIMEEFFGLKGRSYSYLIDHVREDKKAKGTKVCVTKKT